MKQQWHSGFDDSSGWGRLIDPVCLFILCQIAGTIWVITPRKAFAPPVAPNATVDIQRTEVEGFTTQKAALEKALKLARQELATLAAPVEATLTENDRLTAEIRVEEQQVKDLEEKLRELARKEADLTSKIAAVPRPSPQLEKEAEQLAPQLASRQDDVKRLQRALDQTNGPLDDSVGSPRMVEANTSFVRLHLIANRAVPIDTKHYKAEAVRLRATGEQAARLTKSVPGETVDDIRKSDSDFAAFLQKIDPSKQVILCSLTSESFPIFRAVRKLARERGIKVAWETNYDSDGILIFIQGNPKVRVGEDPGH